MDGATAMRRQRDGNYDATVTGWRRRTAVAGGSAGAKMKTMVAARWRCVCNAMATTMQTATTGGGSMAAAAAVVAVLQNDGSVGGSLAVAAWRRRGDDGGGGGGTGSLAALTAAAWRGSGGYS